MPAAKRPAPRQPAVAPPQKDTPEIVDPGWLLKALGVCLVAALVCAWLTACLLVYQGEWQLMLHPSRTVDRTPASVGLAYTEVAFGAAETGQPRLTGWWIPADAPGGLQGKYAAYTFLYLHGGTGSLSDAVPALARLHRAGLNVFAFDYRGFGMSDASAHPSSGRMAEDAAAALDYLTATRHIAERDIVPYGAGLGGSLAAGLALGHPELPAVVLDNPDPDPAAAAVAAHPSQLLPVRLLFGDQFDVAGPLGKLATAKLLIAGGPGCVEAACDPKAMETLFRGAASPRFAVMLPRGGGEADLQTALARFLDQSLAGK
jgi:pimeloyl-ACP methyl ester carboxylesterase